MDLSLIWDCGSSWSYFTCYFKFSQNNYLLPLKPPSADIFKMVKELQHTLERNALYFWTCKPLWCDMNERRIIDSLERQMSVLLTLSTQVAYSWSHGQHKLLTWWFIIELWYFWISCSITDHYHCNFFVQLKQKMVANLFNGGTVSTILIYFRYSLKRCIVDIQTISWLVWVFTTGVMIEV